MTGGALDKYREALRAELERLYSKTVAEHAISPKNMGDIGGYSGFGIVTGPCGDTMAMWLKIENDTIINASFTTDGCTTTIAAGSMVTEMVKGKAVTEAQRIGQQDVLIALDGLPEESEHCALLAADTLKEAINDHLAS